MPSIIIPAHNEASVIKESLSEYIEKIYEPGFEVIVVCNGCTDNTSLITKEISDKLICIETDVASKTYAINLGESVANYYPIIYQDADIILTVDAVNAICEGFKEGYLAMSIEPSMDTDNSSWFVKAYYDIWLSLPYCKAGMIGSGVYAISEKGRERFYEFPDIIADDGYVRCNYKENERGVVNTCRAIVKAPKNLASLLKIKTRSRLGGYELFDKYPNLVKSEVKNYKTAAIDLLCKIQIWPKLVVYIAVNLITRIRAKSQYKKNDYIWERDDSNR